MDKVSTKCIQPHEILRPFLKYFAIRQFDTGDAEFAKPMYADHEMTMVFFYRSRPVKFESTDERSHIVIEDDASACFFTGVQTYTKGFVIFKGQTTLLNIHFKPAGFFYIFNIAPKELVDQMGGIETILSNEICRVQEQLNEMTSLADCISHLEKYLIGHLLAHKPKYKNNQILPASDFLIQQGGVYPIKKLATDCNMTIQTFEVQFVEQVGISPKYFTRILKFGLAINRKLYQPTKSWTEIAYRYGFYDQVHFNKVFKEFSGTSPKEFMKIMNLPLEDFT